MKKPESNKSCSARDAVAASELWTDGLVCAFEYISGPKKSVVSKSGFRVPRRQQTSGYQSRLRVPSNGLAAETSFQRLHSNNVVESGSQSEVRSNTTASFGNEKDSLVHPSGQLHSFERHEGSYWVPIGWARISELVQTVQVGASWASQHFDFTDDEDDLTVADLAAPYWERPAGPVWWCHVSAGHPTVEAWLSGAQWLHPAISLALRGESRLISEKMKHLLYEVPLRVAGGLLFELLGQSAADPYVDEDDIPIVLRSWQAQNFLITVLHLKGPVSNVNVLGITEIQELLSAGGYNTPRTVHEVIAHLAC